MAKRTWEVKETDKPLPKPKPVSLGTINPNGKAIKPMPFTTSSFKPGKTK